jgi:hypothetical protein
MASMMSRGNGEDSVAEVKSVGMESATYAKSIDTIFDLPRAADEATDIEAMSLMVRVWFGCIALACLCLSVSGYVCV